MAYDMTFRGRLEFASAAAIAAALAELDEDGCWAESAIERQDLALVGQTIVVDWHGSAPALFWDITLHVLESLAQYACGGEVVATYDGGEGEDSIFTERILAGAEDHDA